MRVYLDVISTVTPTRSSTAVSQVNGILRSVDFKEGHHISVAQLLIGGEVGYLLELGVGVSAFWMSWPVNTDNVTCARQLLGEGSTKVEPMLPVPTTVIFISTSCVLVCVSMGPVYKL